MFLKNAHPDFPELKVTSSKTQKTLHLMSKSVKEEQQILYIHEAATSNCLMFLLYRHSW